MARQAGILLLLLFQGAVWGRRLFGQIDDNIKPHHYELLLKPDFYGAARSISGKVSIHFEVGSPTRRFQYHAGTKLVGDVTLCSTSKCNVARVVRSETDREDIVTLTLDRDLLKQSYILHTEFTTDIETVKNIGFYISQEGNTTVALTLLQPTLARTVFPCIDQPNMKATFQLTIARKLPYITLTNTPIVSTRNQDDGWIADTFAKTVKMSTYIVSLAIISGYHEQRFVTKSGTRVGVWMDHDDIQPIGAETAEMLEFMEEYTGEKYPMEKYDNIGFTKYWAGAMENYGLVTWGKETLTSPLAKWVSGHEIAHQWIGNLVTVSDWSFTWMQEGGATFFAYHVATQVLRGNDRRYTIHMHREQTKQAMEQDCKGTAEPIVKPIKDSADFMKAFDQQVYSKGAAVYHMIYDILGPTKFRDFWRKLLAKYQYSNVNIGEYVAVMQDLVLKAGDRTGDRSGFHVMPFLKSWLQQPGIAVVTVTREGGGVSVRQHRLDTRQSKVENLPEHLWEIPLTIDTPETLKLDHARRPITWLRRRDLIKKQMPGVTSSTDFIIGDATATAYYVINYDVENWQRIGRAIEKSVDILDEEVRIRLWVNLGYLKEGNEIDVRPILYLSRYLKHETSVQAWTEAIEHLNKLNEAFPANRILTAYMKSTIRVAERLLKQNLEDPLSQQLKIKTCRLDPNLHLCQGYILNFNAAERLRRSGEKINIAITGIHTIPAQIIFDEDSLQVIYEFVGKNATMRREFVNNGSLKNLAKVTYSAVIIRELEGWSMSTSGTEAQPETDEYQREIERAIRIIDDNVGWKEQNQQHVEQWTKTIENR